MAGMLPGVECARRRRLHRGGDSPGAAGHGWSRRPSFCLYTSNHETNHASLSSSLRSILSQAYEDGKLGAVAREAKERLDGRLKTQRKPESTRENRPGRLRGVEGRSMGATGELQLEVFDSRSTGLKRFNWAKMSWQASEQDECTICLEGFKSGEILVHLQCAHRFHSRCLVPWLENNAHCPCCRMEIQVELIS